MLLGGWPGSEGGVPVALTPPIAPQTSTAGNKGDLLLVSSHLIELITRLHQTLMAATSQALALHITDQYGRGRGGQRGHGLCGWGLGGWGRVGGVHGVGCMGWGSGWGRIGGS